MTLNEQIMKLQTYKMFEGEDTVYVERDDVLKLLEQEPKTDTLDKIRAEIERTETNSYIRDVVKGYINELSIPKDDYKGIMGWIPVSEKLPEANIAVLTYIDTGAATTYCLAYWNDVRGAWEDWLGYELIEKDRGYKVLAWMSLPEPYKAESEVQE